MIYRIKIDRELVGDMYFHDDICQKERDSFKLWLSEMIGVRYDHIRFVPEGQNSHLKGKKYADTVNGRVYF